LSFCFLNPLDFKGFRKQFRSSYFVTIPNDSNSEGIFLRILTKIYILLLTSVIALIATSLIANYFKSQELNYYLLVEQIKTLQYHTSDALAFEKNFEKTFRDGDLVYDALESAEIQLKKIHFDLLRKEAGKISDISKLLNVFRKSFKRMVENVTRLSFKKEQINTLTTNYATKNEIVRNQIDEQISAGVFTFITIDLPLLEVLKNDTLSAFTSINRIVLLVNQDLLLEGNIKRFNKNYLREIRNLEIQQKNISMYVKSMKEPLYKELSAQLIQVYLNIDVLVSQLENLYIENQDISQDIQNHKTVISRITQQIPEPG